MRKQQQIKIGRRVINLLPRRALGRGMQRSCFATDYKWRGKEFVVKRANSNNGRITNKWEAVIYQHGKIYGYHKFLPVILGVSECGTWLLIERCIPADRFTQKQHEQTEPPYYYFPTFMHNDMHDGNWGITKHGKRQVMFDLGYDSGHLSVVASNMGVPNDVCERLAA